MGDNSTIARWKRLSAEYDRLSMFGHDDVPGYDQWVLAEALFQIADALNDK